MSQFRQMWKQIGQFSAMERPARGIFLRASVLLPLISVGLRWLGFSKTKGILEHFLSLSYGSQNPDTQARAHLTTKMTRAAERHGVGNSSCLAISLALWWLLARQGIASDLCVGIRKEAEKFEAHAWVECGGTSLNEPETEHHHFVAFDRALASVPPERH